MYRLLSLPFLLISFISYSQQKYPNTLLWRISGKGLNKPSYLYGTMHLTDKRIFNFGDSVYSAIEKSDGLAIELNPDEMGAYLVNEIMEEAEGTRLSELLNKKDFHKYGPALAKKFKKSADQVTTKDIVKEKNKWISEFLEKGEMPTFVDAWLYNFARRQGKWVGGIEDMADQSGLMEELVDKSDIDYLLAADTTIKKTNERMVNHMVDLYVNQDLGGILAMSNSEFADEKDLLLIKRNVKMARRIDSLLALRTLFVAIGAAHLPGDSGVIHLLTKRGFTVEPVFSSQKINALQYPIKEVPVPWQTIEDRQKLYTVAMPGNPATVKFLNLIEMKFLLDITNLSGYCTMATVHTMSIKNKDSLLNKVVSQVFKKNIVKAGRKVRKDGVEGNEYIQLEDGENIRMQAFVRGKVVYLAFMYGMKKEHVSSADADKFFASFSINQSPAPEAGNFNFTDTVIGISFTAPAELTHNNKLSNENQNGWKVSCWNGSDIANGSYIMLFSKELPAGRILVSDSLVQTELLQNMSGKCNNLQNKDTIIAGQKAMQLIGENAAAPGIFMRALSFVRNNKNILFLIVSDSSHLYTTGNEKMFGSLRFFTPPSTWGTHPTPDGACRAWTPNAFRHHAEDMRPTFLSYDTTTSTSYMVIADTMNKYTWFDSDSSFWETNILVITGGDSLVSEKDIRNGPLKGKEILVMPKEATGEYKRMRLLVRDTIFYKLLVSGKKDLIYNPNTDRFFSGFTVLAPSVSPNFITTSKAKLILTDLTSKDSVTRAGAAIILDDLSWSKKDTSILREAIFKTYRSPYDNDTTAYINISLASILANIGDTGAIDFIKAQYPTLTGNKAILRNAALAVLSNLQTQKSYSTLAAFMKQQPPVEPLDMEVISGLRDSLTLTATVYPVLLQLLADSAHAPGLSNLVLQLRDSGFISRQQIMPAEKDLLHTAMKLLPQAKKEEDPYNLYELVKLISSFKTPASNKVLKAYLGVKDKWLKKNVVKYLLQNKQVVPVAVLNALAADTYYRTYLYEDLKELKRTGLFPKQYLTQAHFAASAMHQAAADDYEPQKVVFLSTKTGVYHKKKYLFYLYKVVYEGDEEPETYLGIAGGYVPGSSSLEPKTDLTGLYWDRSYNAALVNEYVKEYLKNQDDE